MDPDRSLGRFFAWLTVALAVLAGIAALILRAWWPLIAVGVVGAVAIISLGEATLFRGLLNLVLHAGDQRKHDRKPPRGR